ncbi:hypothetical protein Tco_1238432 [Tanacetum coccineum]
MEETYAGPRLGLTLSSQDSPDSAGLGLLRASDKRGIPLFVQACMDDLLFHIAALDEDIGCYPDLLLDIVTFTLVLSGN